MLRVERAELFLHARRLDPAIHELDLAYRAGDHEPRIAFYAAALLATARRYDEARAWAKKPMGRPWNWKDWFAQTDRQARELIDAIDEGQREDKLARKMLPPNAAGTTAEHPGNEGDKY